MTSSATAVTGRFILVQSWKMLIRDWRGGELTILIAGLIIAITSITSVGFFTDRIEKGLEQQSSELIAADLVVTSVEDSVNRLIEDAARYDLVSARTQQFRSVVLAEERPQLVEVKSVTDNYPLRGHLRISETAFGKDFVTDEIPKSGALWVESRLLQLLGLSIGDRLQLGEVSFRLDKVLRYEPDRAGDLYSVAPRVLMNEADLEDTKLIGVGSRISYRVLLAGPSQKIDSFREGLEKTKKHGEQVLTVNEGRPELTSALERARQFLGLAALISVLLAGVAVATVTHRFTKRHLDTSAMLRSLGASQNTIIRLFMMEMVWISLISSTIGCLLGLIAQSIIAELLDQLILAQLPTPSYKPVVLGYMTGFIMLIGFALPPLLTLKTVPPLRVLRKDIPSTPVSVWSIYLIVTLCMSVLLYWQVGDLKLVFTLIAGIAVTLIVLAIVAYGMIEFINSMRGRAGIAWRFGVVNLAKRPVASVIQIVSFGIGIMVLLLLSTVRSDLIADWQRSLPPEAPNHFVINIQPEQVEPITRYFHDLGSDNTKLYPMVRARLVAINDREVSTDDYVSERAKHMVTRAFNLSWAETMQIDNTMVSGRWWTEDDHGKQIMSFESKLAKTLGVELGDTLGFDINGQIMTFTITSLRTVDWDTFNINFFTVVPPEVLEDEAASWVTSVYLDETQRSELGDLVKRYPNITLIDVDVIMKRVRGIMDKVSLAVEFIFLFTLLAGIAVLYAAIQSSQDERRYENAVLRTLGAKKNTLLVGLLTEFSLLGGLSGLLAGVSATSLALLLSELIFKFDYMFDASVVLIGVTAGLIIVVTTGLFGTRRVLRHPPIESLREGSL